VLSDLPCEFGGRQQAARKDPGRPGTVCCDLCADRHSRVVRMGQALSSGLAAVLAELPQSSTANQFPGLQPCTTSTADHSGQQPLRLCTAGWDSGRRVPLGAPTTRLRRPLCRLIRRSCPRPPVRSAQASSPGTSACLAGVLGPGSGLVLTHGLPSCDASWPRRLVMFAVLISGWSMAGC